MNVKVNCPCGQAFEFEVEPQNGAMPCAINCPTCGADSTQLANQLILAQSVPSPIPPPAAPASGLRMAAPASRPVPNPADTPAEAAPPAESPKRFGYTRSLEPDKTPPPSRANIPMGILGGVGAGLVAMLIWYGIALTTHYEIGLIATLVGFMAGVGVRSLARDGSQMLGYIAALCAALAILGGKYLLVGHYVNEYLNTKGASAYQDQMARAREVVQLKTDTEIRDWLLGKIKDSAPASPDELQRFRTVTQPRMQAFLDGTPSQAVFERGFRDEISSFAIKFSLLKNSVTAFTMLWLVLGVLSAWRVASK